MYNDELYDVMDHSRKDYECKEVADCPYIGTRMMEKVPWVEGETLEEVMASRNSSLLSVRGRKLRLKKALKTSAVSPVPGRSREGSISRH